MHHIKQAEASKANKDNESISTNMSVQGCDLGMSPAVQKFTVPSKKKKWLNIKLFNVYS